MSKKIFISTDIEGTAGACTWECGKKGTWEYQQQCEVLKRELLALVDGINQTGKDYKITIKDAHSTGWNYDILDFPENCEIIRGWDDGLFCMMQGLDETFDAAVLLGYHSCAGTAASPLAHTFHSRRYQRIVLNGELLSEFLISYYISALYNVPVIMLSGDKGICEEAVRYDSSIMTVIVQEGKGGSVVSISEKRAEQMLNIGIREALKNQERKKCILPAHFVMDLTYFSHTEANKYAYYPGCVRMDANTVRYETDDFRELLRALLFL